MNKRNLLVVVMILLSAIMLAGCSVSQTELSVENSTTANYKVKNAEVGAANVAGSLVFEENQSLSVECDLSGKSEVTLELFAEMDPTKEISFSELDEMLKSAQPDLNVKLSGNNVSEYDMAPGSYYVRFTVTATANGTVKMNVK